ncbi:MAG TPA: sugar ABC transporter permease [Capsulimonadaceae bacterium]|nr:sugar ABC transporter permease [Capsulimonadaceae bacterium]
MSTTITRPQTEGPPPAPPRPVKTQGVGSIQRRMAPYIFVSPFVLLFAVFGVWPILHSLVLAFYHTVTPTDQNFIGLKNFRDMFGDPDFWTAVKNTVVYTLFSVFLQLPLALFLAIFLNVKWLKGRSFFRLAFFSPNLMGQVFVGLLFQVLFVSQYGLVTKAFHFLFHTPLDIKWLGDPAYVMPALVLTSLWMYVGFNMIYFLAALQAVDKELYDAALVDGANPWQTFWAVTLPGIKPVAIFVLVTATIGSFQLFELPWIMLNNGAGPQNSGLTVVMYLYQWGFIKGNLGYASAVGWTLALGVLLISLIQMRLTGALKKADG